MPFLIRRFSWDEDSDVLYYPKNIEEMVKFDMDFQDQDTFIKYEIKHYTED